ncbi:MAG: type II toxin-antitoxin system RatA family toxin [Rhodospirillales bacterium]|nr:type II toxin-antitoxin system RatA family toxin [Rhodospirillales bacterium]
MPHHTERRLMPYTPEQLFDLVADVDRYPEFLPWCIATRVRQKSENDMVADMVIGFKMFRESFTSRVTLNRPDKIKVTYENGPFKYLENHWIFESSNDGCILDFSVDFEFKSRLLEKAIGAVFQEAVHRMVGAFEIRAKALYGN